MSPPPTRSTIAHSPTGEPDSASAAAGAPLDDLQRSLVATLDENGYAIVTLADLVTDADLVRAVEEQGAAFISRTEAALASGDAGEAGELKRRPGKEFVIRALSFESVRLGLDDAWFRTCVSDRLLDLANAYLRMWAKLSYVDLWYTVPQAPGSERAASQLWHLDFDDKHLLKAFLYLNDVDAGAGPFEYVPGSQARGRYDSIWHWSPLRSGRIPDEQVRSHVGDDGIKTFTAPRGTVILCNTSGLHRGGFSTESPRVLATATYCSPASLRALSRRNFVPSPDAVAALSAAGALRGRLKLRLVPLQEWPHDTAEVPGVAASRAVSVDRVLHVEGNDLADLDVRRQLDPAERADGDVDRVQPLAEEVAGNPGRRGVLARPCRLDPLLPRVERVERDVALTVDDLDLGKERLAEAEDVEGDLDADGLADVGRVEQTTVPADDPHRAQPRQVLAGRRGRIRPLPGRPRTRLVLEVVGDDRPGRAVESHLPALEEKRAVAETRDGGHVVRDEQDRAAR